MIKRIRIVTYGSNIFFSFFSFLAKTIQRISKCPLGRRNSIWIQRRYRQKYILEWKWNDSATCCFFNQISLTPPPPPPFSLSFSAGQFWVFDYRDHPSDFVYIYSLCWDLSELWLFVRVPVNSKLCTVNSVLLST